MSGGPLRGEGNCREAAAGASTRQLSRWEWLSLVAPLVLAALVHAPSLKLGFAGDDFQWWQHARMAVERFSLLFAPFASFRPTNTWSLAVNQVLFGADPVGYHATNLMLSLACGVLFWLLARRLMFSVAARAALVSLWICSPFSLEPMQWATTRYNLVLLLLWLGMALLWPRPGENWGRTRFVALIGLAVLSMLTSESWVVLPGLVVAFDLLLARSSFRRAAVAGAICSLAVLTYVAFYISQPPINPSVYYSGEWTPLARLPHAWAAMSYLTTLRPLDFSVGGAEILALVSIATLAWVAWRRRNSTIALGLALFVLSFIPVLPVAYMATRYTTIPLVGFLVAVAGGIVEGMAVLSPRQRSFASAATATVVLLALFANLAWLRGDYEDAHTYSNANARLVAEAREILPILQRGQPIVAVRLERINLPAELAPAARGIPKLYFPRHSDPYSLADWGAVFSYVLDPVGGPILVKVAPETQEAEEFVVLAHIDGGFALLPNEGVTVSDVARWWKERGHPVCVLAPW